MTEIQMTDWPFREFVTFQYQCGLERLADIHITAADADSGQIKATIAMRYRKVPKEVVLRFRHPKAAPMKGVAATGKEWKDFNPDEGDWCTAFAGTFCMRFNKHGTQKLKLFVLSSDCFELINLGL